jgi:hypothetical protein
LVDGALDSHLEHDALKDVFKSTIVATLRRRGQAKQLRTALPKATELVQKVFVPGAQRVMRFIYDNKTEILLNEACGTFFSLRRLDRRKDNVSHPLIAFCLDDAPRCLWPDKATCSLWLRYEFFGVRKPQRAALAPFRESKTSDCLSKSSRQNDKLALHW